jgi:hypothetical protein
LTPEEGSLFWTLQKRAITFYEDIDARSDALKLAVSCKAHVSLTNLKLCGKYGELPVEEKCSNDVAMIDHVQSN